MFTVAAIPFDTGVVQQKSYKKGAYESIDNIDKILLYCNTKNDLPIKQKNFVLYWLKKLTLLKI